jgi:hypothetical protein
MNATLKNTLAVIAGLVAGALLNGAIINLSGKIIPPPDGADVTTLEGLKASIHLFEPKHFLMPFLAHALGALAGAWIAARFAATRQITLALVVGVFFFVGGIINVAMLPAPMWFNVVDLAGAYFPFAYLGGKLATRNR